MGDSGTGFEEFGHFWFPPWAGGDDDNDDDRRVYNLYSEPVHILRSLYALIT